MAHRLHRVLAVLLPGALAACAGFPGHPVRLSKPRLEGPVRSAAGTLPEPEAPTGRETDARLFLGLEGLLEPLAKLRAQTVVDPQKPVLARFPTVEASVRERYAAGGFGGPVRHVVVLGATGRVPLAPARMAALLLNPDVERQVLAADAFRPIGRDFVLPGASRERFRVAKLRQGFGPFRFDLRFSAVIERREASDGRVLLRYDPGAEPAPENVTLWRGACLIEPEEGGARVTELVVLGTSIKVPPFLVAGLRQLVEATLSHRATNLWVRAWQ